MSNESLSTVQSAGERTGTQRRLVVGVDGSPESDAALRWAMAVAQPTDVIDAVHVWDVPVAIGYETAIVIDPDEVADAARDFLAQIIAEVDDDRVRPVLERGNAGTRLVECAAGADGVVLGHRGRSRVSMMLGSVATHVLHHVSIPVVILRGDHSGTPRHVVVGADDHDLVISDDADGPVAGTNESVRALQWAWSLPGVERVTVVHGWFLPAVVTGWYAGPGPDTVAMDAAAEAVAAHVVQAAGPAPDGVDVDIVARRGTGPFALIEESRTADLVVVGSRGRGTLRGLLLGSTSAELTAYAHSPVAVVR